MQRTNDLTDRAKLTQNRARAVPAGLFLHREAADELQERRGLVNRSFKSVAVVTPFADFWKQIFPEARIVPDTETLDLEPESHDLVIHALALHWANDPVGQMIQARRALMPDGLFLAACFGGQTLWQLRAALAEAETAVTGGLSPRVAPMAEIRDLGALLQRAGFTLPVADSVSHTVTYATPRGLMRDLRGMGEVNAMTARQRCFTRRQVIAEAERRYASAYGMPDGRIPATFEIIYLTGWAPSDTQPRPLRPGSAKARLADALGVPEAPLRGMVAPGDVDPD